LSRDTDRHSYLCIALGRPPLLSPNLTVPKKDEPLNTQIITGLFDITKSILITNQEPKATFDGVCHSIWNNHARLESFWEEHEPTLLIAHTDPASPGHVEEGMFLDTISALLDPSWLSHADPIIVYEYAVIANLKPFLLYLGYSHIVNRHEKDPFLVELESSTPVRQDPRVEKALEIILASAKRIISLIFGICQRGSVSKVCVSPKVSDKLMITKRRAVTNLARTSQCILSLLKRLVCRCLHTGCGVETRASSGRASTRVCGAWKSCSISE
jgi:hypothetical protein